MKFKALLLFMVAVLMSFTCSARDTYSTDASVLPQAASSVLSAHFANKAVSHIKIDHGMLGVESYEVILADGTEIDFDGKGILKEVDCARTGNVPATIIPESIRNYVASNYPHQNIVKYDVKRSGYEIELQSGVELNFNKQGRFHSVDD